MKTKIMPKVSAKFLIWFVLWILQLSSSTIRGRDLLFSCSSVRNWPKDSELKDLGLVVRWIRPSAAETPATTATADYDGMCCCWVMF